MDETPAKHWFRFRLSTVLIVTAIAAWAMATPRTYNHQFPNPHLVWPVLTLAIYVGWNIAWATPDENRSVRSWLVVGAIGAMCTVATFRVAREIAFLHINQTLAIIVITMLAFGPLICVTAITGLLITLWRLSEDP